MSSVPHHDRATVSAALERDPTTDDVAYTCPMHPEIRQSGPGACPICGMALEPVVVTAETGPSAELAADRLSSAYLIAAAGRAIRDVAVLKEP